MDNQKFFQLQNFTLAGSGCSLGDTSIILSSMLDIDGNAVAMTDFGSKAWITLEPGNSNQEEQISFTGLTPNSNGTVTLTGVKNVAFKSPYTETSGVLKTHPGGAIAIISNTSAFYDSLTSKENDETIDGIYTFTQSPIVPTPVSTSTTAAASVDYVNNVAIAGSPKAGAAVFGISKLSIAPATASVPIAVGTNDTRVSPVSLVSLTGSQVAALVGDSTTVAVPSATNAFVTQQGLQRKQETYAVATGNSAALVVALSPAPIALIAGMQVNFKSPVSTIASPTLNVNSLGAKSLVKATSTGTTTLVVGDIATNVLVLAEFNGVEWQILSPTTVYTTGLGAWASATADGNGYQVTNDGFLVGNFSHATGGANTPSTIYSDSAATPTTVRVVVDMNNISYAGQSAFCVPIKKNDYYKIVLGTGVTAPQCFFIPLS